MSLHRKGIDKEYRPLIEMAPEMYITVEEAVFEILKHVSPSIWNEVYKKCKPRKDLGKDDR